MYRITPLRDTFRLLHDKHLQGVYVVIKGGHNTRLSATSIVITRIVRGHQVINNMNGGHGIVRTVMRNTCHANIRQTPCNSGQNTVSVSNTRIAYRLINGRLGTITVGATLPILYRHRQPLTLTVNSRRLNTLRRTMALIQEHFINRQQRQTRRIMRPFRHTNGHLVRILSRRNLNLLVYRVHLGIMINNRRFILALRLRTAVHRFTVRFIRLQSILNGRDQSARRQGNTVRCVKVKHRNGNVNTTILLNPRLLTRTCQR